VNDALLQKQSGLQIFFGVVSCVSVVKKRGGVQTFEMYFRVVDVEEVEPFVRHVGLAHGKAKRMPQISARLLIDLIRLPIVERRLDHWLRETRGHHQVILRGFSIIFIVCINH